MIEKDHPVNVLIHREGKLLIQKRRKTVVINAS